MVVYNGDFLGKRVFFVGYPVRRARVYYYRKRVGVVFVVPLRILLPKERGIAAVVPVYHKHLFFGIRQLQHSLKPQR